MPKVKEILDRKRARKARLEASLDTLVRQLKRLGALKIILFGSLARGNVDVDSDLDLFVLMPPTRTGREWTDTIYTDLERKVAANIVAYNQKEFEERLTTSSFLKNVLKGKTVYEKAA